jgi:bla regulator protein BlaR1
VILGIFDHLWQSTLFAMIAGLLVLTMRANRANARFCLWFVASLKFLMPFSLLIGIGKQLGWTGVTASTQWTLIISDIARPSSIFSMSSLTQSNTSHSYGLYAAMAVWAIGFVAVIARWALPSAESCQGRLQP